MTRFLISFLCLLVFASPALAHSPLKTSSPAANETLAKMPESINLIFAKAARVTKVTLTHTIGDVSHSDRLELPSKKFITEMALNPEQRGAGTYKLDWRALGEDGHALKGSFSFEVTE